MVQALIHELRRQELSSHESDYLPDHGLAIQETICDKDLRGRNVWVG